MSLASAPAYDREGCSDVGEEAVVLGASVAGLCAARVLADGFERVTLVERDPLPEGPSPRRGVPQSSQPHLLWEAGRATFETLLPGYSEELVEAGAVVVDGRTEMHSFSRGDFLAEGSRPLSVYFATRPVYEHVLRRRVLDFDRLEVRSECRFVDFLTDGRGETVAGVEVRDGDGGTERLDATLVVDATGRTSRTPAWLGRHGYTPPTLEEVTIDVAYSTAFLERSEGERRAFGVLAEAPRTRGGVAAPVEGGQWLLNLHGVHGDHPPTDRDGLRAFAERLPTPVLSDLIETHGWVDGEVHHYRLPSSRRYRYEDLEGFPGGLVVLGDALASFNPLYGQGMSVAALEALALHRALADGTEGVGPRFFAEAASVVDTAWSMAVGADFGYAETTGPRPRGVSFFNWYLGRLLRKAHADGRLTDAFNAVLTMQEPPSTLLRPRIAWRVLRPAIRSPGTTLERETTGRPRRG